MITKNVGAPAAHQMSNLLPRPTSPSPPVIPEENPLSYPLVTFWNKSDWVRFQEGERQKPIDPARVDKHRDENTKAPYIQDERGIPVNASTLKEMRKTARRVWVSFLNKGEAPPQWGKASSKVVNAYRSEMRRQHPELRLCSNDWKSEALATQAYSSWYQNHGRKPVKSEESTPALVESRSSRTKRRVDNRKDSEASNESFSKKQKLKDTRQASVSDSDDGMFGDNNNTADMTISIAGAMDGNQRSATSSSSGKQTRTILHVCDPTSTMQCTMLTSCITHSSLSWCIALVS